MEIANQEQVGEQKPVNGSEKMAAGHGTDLREILGRPASPCA
jgi:hypothetical protein